MPTDSLYQIGFEKAKGDVISGPARSLTAEIRSPPRSIDEKTVNNLKTVEDR